MQPINFPSNDLSSSQGTPEPKRRKKDPDISTLAETALQSAPQEKGFGSGLIRVRNFARLHSRITQQALENLPDALKTEENIARLLGKPHPKAIVLGWEFLLEKNIATPALLSAIASHPHADRLSVLIGHFKKGRYPVTEDEIRALINLPLTDSKEFNNLDERLGHPNPFVSYVPSRMQILLEHENPYEAMEAYAILCCTFGADGIDLAETALKSKRPALTAIILELLWKEKQITPDNVIRSIRYPEEAYRKYRDKGWVPFYVWFSQLPTEAQCSP